MRKSIILFAVFNFVTNISCCKEPAKPAPYPPKEERLEILWRTSIVPDVDVNYAHTMNPYLYEDRVIFGTEYNLGTFTAPIMFIDTASGEIEEYWSDYINRNSFYYYGEKSAQDGGFLILRNQTSINAINLQTKQTQWQSILPSGPWVYANNGYVYVGIRYNADRSSAILRSSVNQMAWDTVFAFTKTDKYNPGFDSFGFGQLPTDDEVIVWKNRNWGAAGSITDIFAFNLTADTLMWRNRDLDINSGIIPLKIDNGIVYGLVRNRAFAMDLLTGTLLWQVNVNQLIDPTFSLEFFAGDLHIEGSKVIIMGQSDELFALDKKTGTLLWLKQNAGDILEDRFTYFEGKLFFASQGLRIVDANTGEPLISQSLSEEIDDIQSKIVIDPQRRVMYFHNGREAFCVKIPEDV